MTNNRASNKVLITACAGAALVLTGCSGTTYGTGVTQESQLVSDVAGLVTLGSRQKKDPIDYSARPGLVKAPSNGQLPPPVESAESRAGYFPQNPEERRQALRREAGNADETLARGGQLSPELQAARDESRRRAVLEDRRARNRITQKDDTESYQEIVEKREAYEAQKVRREGVSSPTARKYLTQPPVEYRQPSETAPVGVVGERERDPKQINKQPRKSIIKRIFG